MGVSSETQSVSVGRWPFYLAISATFALSVVVTAAVVINYGHQTESPRPADRAAPLPEQEAPNQQVDDRQTVDQQAGDPKADPGKRRREPSAPRPLRGHSQTVSIIDVSSDGAQLLSADVGDLIRTWDRFAGVPLVKIEPAGLRLRRAIFSANSRFILGCDKDNTIRMWKANDGESVREFRGHTDLVSALACVPGTDRFISSGFDSSLILWNMRTGEQIRQFGTATNARTIAPKSQQDLAELDGHFTWIRDVAVLPDGNQAISAGNDAVLFFWDLGSGKAIDRLIGHNTAIVRLVLSRDGRFAVSLSADNELLIWDVADRKLIRRTKNLTESLPALAISPNSRTLAAGDSTGTIQFVELESGQARRQIDAGGIAVTALAFTPELHLAEIVAGYSDGTIRIWPAPLQE